MRAARSLLSPEALLAHRQAHKGHTLQCLGTQQLHLLACSSRKNGEQDKGRRQQTNGGWKAASGNMQQQDSSMLSTPSPQAQEAFTHFQSHCNCHPPDA